MSEWSEDLFVSKPLPSPPPWLTPFHFGIVAVCIMCVSCAALFQHTVVLGGEPQPRFFVVASVVGGLFGVVLVGVRRIVEVKRIFARALTEHSERIEQLNAELEQRVTERTTALEAKHEQLLRAQRLEMVGKLVAGVAHDFNNLLTVIEFGCSALEKRHDPTLIESIRAAAERGQRLSRQLVQTARRDSKDDELPLREVVDELVDLLERSFGQRYSIEVAHDGDSRSVDATRVEQVLLNLLVNARDAQPAGGTIRVRTRTDAGRTLLEVEDFGSGIPEELREKVFEPFFTTKGEGEGSGLGLATVRSVVDELGGSVGLAPVEAGTCVQVEIPQRARRSGVTGGRALVRVAGGAT